MTELFKTENTIHWITKAIMIDGYACTTYNYLLNGTRKMAPLRGHYYYDARFTLLLFALNNRESFFELFTQWLPEVTYYNADQVFVLVGTNDDILPWQISQAEVELMAKKYQCSMFLTIPSQIDQAVVSQLSTHVFRCMNKQKPASACNVQ